MKKILFLLVVAMLIPGTVGAQEGRIYDNFGNSRPLQQGTTTQMRYYSPGCPVCGSEEKMLYGEEYYEFIALDDVVFYVCNNCGNVYAKRKGGDEK